MVSIYYARLVNTVVFDDNQGVNGPGVIFARSGNVINIKDSQPTRAGYTFDGWYKQNPDGSETKMEESEYSLGYTVPTDSKTTYKAHWLEPTTPRYITVVYWGQLLI